MEGVPHHFCCVALVAEVTALSQIHALGERRETLTVWDGRTVVVIVANNPPQKVCFLNVAKALLNRWDPKGRAEESGVPAHLRLLVCGQDVTFFPQLVQHQRSVGCLPRSPQGPFVQEGWHG